MAGFYSFRAQRGSFKNGEAAYIQPDVLTSLDGIFALLCILYVNYEDHDLEWLFLMRRITREKKVS